MFKRRSWKPVLMEEAHIRCVPLGILVHEVALRTAALNRSV